MSNATNFNTEGNVEERNIILEFEKLLFRCINLFY